MKVCPPGLRVYALLVCTALMTACTSPGYNTNPSQQITNAPVGCLAATEFFAVYFSVHIQPSEGNPDARLRKDLFRSYCHDIPTPGRVFFTADLVGSELRRTPIGIRVVEQEWIGGDHDLGENFKDRYTLSEAPLRTYAKGVIETQFELAKNGYYAVYLTRGGDAVSAADTLRVPLKVGVDSSVDRSVTRIALLLGILSALALISLVAFRSRRRAL